MRPAIERRVLGDRLRCDDDACGVNRRVAGHPFEPSRDVEQLLDLRIVLLHLSQRLALVERLVERHVERCRNLLCHLVDVAERHLEDAADVADDRLRLHRPERDDLGDVLAAVLARDVLDDLAAPPLAEIDVDVRQRDPLRIQEPLEDEIEVDWIDVGDAQAIRDEAAGRRSTPRAHRYPLLARVADEVPHDQEVPGVLHLFDHVDFVREAPLVLVDRVPQRSRRGKLLQSRQPLAEPLADDVLEVLVQREAGGNVEVRQVVLAFGESHVASLGDADRVGERVRMIPERVGHLIRRLQKELPRLVPQSLRIAERLSGADAEQDVVRMGVGVAQVMDVVGAHEPEAEVLRDCRNAAVDDPLFLDTVPLHLEEEVLRAENVLVAGRRVARFLVLRVREPFGHFTFETRAQANQAGCMLRQQLLVDARLVIEALGVAGGDELDQVVVALVRFGEQHEVIGGLARIAVLVPPIPRRDVHLAAENRLHALLPRMIVEHHRREKIPVLGDRDRRHLQPRGLIEQLVDPARPIEQRKLSVEMKMNELRHPTPTRSSTAVSTRCRRRRG